MALLERALGSKQVISDPDILATYATDETPYYFIPEAVVRPTTQEQVAELVKICHKEKIPLVARGAGSGLSGGALPVWGGVVIAFEKLNRIVDVDEVAGTMRVESGVTTATIHQVALEHGLYYPPDPASSPTCTIGGNIAEDSAGPHSSKYGTTRHYVLNLKVSTPTAPHPWWTGSHTTKNTAGYNLTQLLVGSEGTLALICEATLKLIPAPTGCALIVVGFPDSMSASRCIGALYTSGIFPAAVEFMEGDVVAVSQQHLRYHPLDTAKWKAFLWIELDTHTDESALMQQAERLLPILAKYTSCEPLLALDRNDRERLWQIRKVTGTAVKSISNYVDADVCVPRSQLPRLLEAVHRCEQSIGLQAFCYGHAADGNIHVNILQGDLPAEKWQPLARHFIDTLSVECLRMGGTFAGEHGTGYLHRHLLRHMYGKEALALLKALKKAFDPHNILNPDKVIPPDE